MRLVSGLHARLRQLPEASGCLSAATFAPPEVNRSSSREGVVRRAVINSKLKSRYGVLRDYGWIASEGNGELWRISLRVRGSDDLDYGALVRKLPGFLQPIQAELRRPNEPVSTW